MENIDLAKVRKAARKVLSKYLSLKRLAGSDSLLQSVTYSDMSKYKTFTNEQKDRVSRILEAKQAYEDIEQAIETLPEIHQDILKRRYFNNSKETNMAISLSLGYSNRTIERYFSQAVMEFAEAYRNGVLFSTSDKETAKIWKA